MPPIPGATTVMTGLSRPNSTSASTPERTIVVLTPLLWDALRRVEASAVGSTITEFFRSFALPVHGSYDCDLSRAKVCWPSVGGATSGIP